MTPTLHSEQRIRVFLVDDNRDFLSALILTLNEHFFYGVAARCAGADGVLTKSKMDEQILPLIHRLFV